MIYTIIRTCKRDDYIARLCYESFLLSGIDSKYYFLADTGDYKYIKNLGVNIVYKSETNNYGGRTGVLGLLSGIQNFNFEEEDTVVISDSDIVIFENFLNLLPEIVDHAGVGGKDEINGLNHISGQMQIFSGKTINRLKKITYDDVHRIVFKEMVKKNINVADDTFNSYMTDQWNCSKYFLPLHKWIHHKFYDYKSREDYANIIKEIKDKFLIK